MTRTETCKERVAGHWESRRKDFLDFIYSENYEKLDEYILDVSHVESHPAVSPQGLHLQYAPYDRIQISYGGPSEEIRYYEDGIVEFVLLDWGDKAEIIIGGNNVLNHLDIQVSEFLQSYFIDVLNDI